MCRRPNSLKQHNTPRSTILETSREDEGSNPNETPGVSRIGGRKRTVGAKLKLTRKVEHEEEEET